jgi:hypothetical protein
MTDWQPIETAPRDGTPFLAYCPGGVKRPGYNDPPEPLRAIALVFESHPNPDQPRGARWVAVDVQVETFSGSELTGSWNEYEWTIVEPTHWMPLPTPPARS